MENKELLKAFKEHAESDQKFQKSIDTRLRALEKKVDVLVEQDERVQWAAKR